MPRDFDGADDYISMSLGNMGATGALSIACVCRPTDLGSLRALVALGLTGNPNFLLRISPSGPFLNTYDSATGGGADGAATLAANTWQVLAMSKAAGTATARFHIYSFATGAWTHENASATNGDPSVSGGAVIGAFDTGAPANDFVGAIAAAAVWRSNLSDTLAEELSTGWSAWKARSPAALWRLDQASTATAVTDLTGGGADQSGIQGTAVSALADPIDWVARTAGAGGAGRSGTLA